MWTMCPLPNIEHEAFFLQLEQWNDRQAPHHYVQAWSTVIYTALRPGQPVHWRHAIIGDHEQRYFEIQGRPKAFCGGKPKGGVRPGESQDKARWNQRIFMAISILYSQEEKEGHSYISDWAELDPDENAPSSNSKCKAEIRKHSMQ